LAVDVVQQQ
jgi:hypothetical protein